MFTFKRRPFASLFLTSALLSPAVVSANPLLGDIEKGKQIYQTFCVACHGAALEGGIGPSLKDEFWAHGSSPNAILNTINKGIAGSEMIGFEKVIPEADRMAIRNFLVSEQQGMRELVKGIYPREFFKNKKLTLDVYESVESDSQTALPENLLSFSGRLEGVIRGTAKLYIKTPGDYQFDMSKKGRTTIYVDGKEVYYTDDKVDKAQHIKQKINLGAGIYDIEILHEEPYATKYVFDGNLLGPDKLKIPLFGENLFIKFKKEIVAQEKAQVIRKGVFDLPPRTLLVLLPNKVLVAVDPDKGLVLKAWKNASIDQSPSLPDRSKKASRISGEEISIGKNQPRIKGAFDYSGYEIKGKEIIINATLDGSGKNITIKPKGNHNFSVSF